MKKTIALLLAAFAIASCSAPGPASSEGGSSSLPSSSTGESTTSETDSSSTTESTEDLSPVTIRICGDVSSASARFLQNKLADFIAEKDYGFEASIAVTELRDGDDGRNYDIFITSAETIRYQIALGYELEAVDPSFAEDETYPLAKEFQIDGEYVCYPFLASPSDVLYYDTSVFAENDLSTWNAMVARLAASESGKKLAFYSAHNHFAYGWFRAAGAKTEGRLDEDGYLHDVTDSFDTLGLPAAKALSSFFASADWVMAYGVSYVDPGVDLAACLGGFWDYEDAQARFGENLGIAPLPGYEVDDVSYPGVGWLNTSGLYIPKITNAKKKAVIHDIGKLMASGDFQLAYANETLGRLPAAQSAIDALSDHPFYQALIPQLGYAEFSYAYSIGQIQRRIDQLNHSILSTAGEADEATLQGYLTTYHESVLDLDGKRMRGIGAVE